MNHNCIYILKSGKRKGQECRRIALWSLPNGDHYCKNHIFKAKVDAVVEGKNVDDNQDKEKE